MICTSLAIPVHCLSSVGLVLVLNLEVLVLVPVPKPSLGIDLGLETWSLGLLSIDVSLGCETWCYESQLSCMLLHIWITLWVLASKG